MIKAFLLIITITPSSISKPSPQVAPAYVNWQCRNSYDCGSNWICDYQAGSAGMCENCSKYPFSHDCDSLNWRARTDCRNICGSYTGSTGNYAPGNSCMNSIDCGRGMCDYASGLSGRCHQCDNQFNSVNDCMGKGFQMRGTVECFARCLDMDVVNYQSSNNWNFKNYMRSYYMYNGVNVG